MTMPPRGGRRVALPQGADGRVDLGAVGAVPAATLPVEQLPVRQQRPQAPAQYQPPAVEPMADSFDIPGDLSMDNLVYPGELLTVSTTLAIILPTDQKESYFGAKHTAIVQPGETYEDISNRSKIVVNNTVRDTVADCLDMIEEWTTPPAGPQQ